MHDSDEEEGFIPSHLEIKNKQTPRARVGENDPAHHPTQRVHYRFGGVFIKKEHPRALITPLTLPEDPVTTPPVFNKNKPTFFQHPYKVYCVGETFTLVYSRNGEDPLSAQKQYLKNQVSLQGIEDHSSPSLKELKSFEVEEDPQGDQLGFDSRFQSGNLHCAYRRRGTQEYHLFMGNDTNTLGYNQWFYFAVSNMQPRTTYTFHIVNYRKPLQFFARGQRIALFSLKEAEQGRPGWRRAGNKYTLQESNIRSSPERRHFVLSFTLNFPHSHDYVLLASSLPYSYSKLLADLSNLQEQGSSSKHARVEVNSVGASLCNNEVPEVTITGRNSLKSDKEKRIVIILARQHPGEVWSSYVALSLMRGLLKESPQAQHLLENYVVKIFPMVNVDGVIYGNFRCDVTGLDLNRRWRDPSRILHPQIFEIKKRVAGLTKRWRVDLCLDLHGHSKKYNIFCYGCKHNAYTCRILPLLLQNHSNLFYMPSCTFGLTKDKETTARATLSRIIRSENVLTVEVSTFGWGTNTNAFHFTPLLLNKFSEQMIVALRFFLDKKSSQFLATQRDIKDNFGKYKQYDQNNEEESGSDSDPEQDEIDFKIKMGTIFDKKYENEYKSFLRQSNPTSLHLSHIVFQEEDTPEQTTEQLSPYIPRSLPEVPEYPRQILVAQSISKERVQAKLPKSTKQELGTPKKTISINQSEIGRDIRRPDPKLPTSVSPRQKSKVINKNIMIRQKKRLSFVNEPEERKTMRLSPSQTIQEQIGRVNLFRAAQKEEEKHRMDNFISKFQRFIPSTFTTKGKGRLQLLEEELDRDDPTYQLNLMLQNKRKIEIERIRRSIQDSTEIVERQGRVKMVLRKDPVIDFKRFKQNEKMKQQLKKLGQFSERYLEGQQ